MKVFCKVILLLLALTHYSVCSVSQSNPLVNDSIVHVAFYSKIYMEPFYDVPVVAICEDQTPLKVLTTKGKWLKVQYKSQVGWINNTNIYESSMSKQNSLKTADNSNVSSSSSFLTTLKTYSIEFVNQNTLLFYTILVVIAFVLVTILIMLYFHNRTKDETVSKRQSRPRNAVTGFHLKPNQNNVSYQVNGTIHDYSLHDILQMFENTRKSGVLLLEDIIDGILCKMTFRSGVIIYAEYNFIEGRAAIVNALQMGKGNFRFVAGGVSENTLSNCHVLPTEIILSNAKMFDEQVHYANQTLAELH